MKKQLTLLILAGLLITSARSQNTFPASGNVGIGTLTPPTKLTVVTGSGVWGVTHTDGTVRVGTYIAGGAGYYGTLSNHPLYFTTNNAAAQAVLLTNGKMGIGTTTPTERLTVRSPSNVVGFAHTDGIVKLGSVLTGSSAIFGTITNHPLHFTTNNGAPQITLAQNGGVGIGTTSPNGRLDVRGGDAYIQRMRIGVGRSNGNGLDSSNTAVGRHSLDNNNPGTTSTRGGDLDVGINNTAVGIETLRSNTEGYGNTAAGAYALSVNTTGYYNTAMGSVAMPRNTTGQLNVAIGFQTLSSNTIGSTNCVVGAQSMPFNRDGGGNSTLGFGTLFRNVSGGGNTACGNLSLFESTGIGNSAFGANTDVNSSNLDYTTIIGVGARATASNQVRIGNNGVLSIGGWQDWTNISDGRVKKNIKEDVPGLSFINLLRPVTYNLDLDEADKLIRQVAPPDKTKNDEKLMEGLKAARDKKEEEVLTGFIAQDVEKAAKALNYQFSGVDAAKNDKDLYGLRYAQFVVPLVKSVQELSKKNDELQNGVQELSKKNDDLQNEVNELKALIADINKKITVTGSSLQNGDLSSASLQQNHPNSFSKSTSIGYTLPLRNVLAKIIITDKAGRKVREVNVSGSGSGNIDINTSTLSAGTYQYSLYVNDILIDSKQMILAR